MKTYSSRPAPGERLESVSCPVCGSAAVRPLPSAADPAGVVFVRCRGCSHLYQNPRPVAADLGGRYDADYTSYEVENAQAFVRLMHLGLRDIGFDRLETHGRRFLDVGCATGALVQDLCAGGWQAEGLELCEPSARWGREHRGVTIHTGTLESAAFPDGSFDVVHSSHVIEHVPDPAAFLRETCRILASGGWCICATPNTASFQARLFGPAWRSRIADHVHLFSVSGLKRLMRASGLTPVRHKTWGGLASGAGAAVLKPLADRLAKLTGLGDVMIILARKQ